MKIKKIDLHGFIEILNQHPPSIILCQSLVIIKEIIKNSTFSDVIEKVLERVIQFSQVETSSDFQGRLMMALSCCSLCFKCTTNFFSGLFGKIFGAFSGNDKILISAATNSLDILVNQNVGLFESNLNNYIEFLIGQSPIYLQNFELEDAVKEFNSITTLIRFYKRRNTLSFTENDENQSVKILHNRLFEPINQI